MSSNARKETQRKSLLAWLLSGGYMHPMAVKLGVWRTTVILSIVAFLFCMLIVIPVNLITNGSIFTGIVITLIISTTLIPYHIYQVTRLLLELEAARSILYHSSVTDELTQVYNRRHFLHVFQAVITNPNSLKKDFAIMIMDIDNFKAINDRYGHDIGDKVIQMVGEIGRSSCRQSDIFARFGGEEFVVLLEGITRQQAIEFAERIRLRISETEIPFHQEMIRCTMSIGVRPFTLPVDDADQLLIQADQVLYRAKNNGKNRVEVFEEGYANAVGSDLRVDL